MVKLGDFMYAQTQKLQKPYIAIIPVKKLSRKLLESSFHLINDNSLRFYQQTENLQPPWTV